MERYSLRRPKCFERSFSQDVHRTAEVLLGLPDTFPGPVTALGIELLSYGDPGVIVVTTNPGPLSTVPRDGIIWAVVGVERLRSPAERARLESA